MKKVRTAGLMLLLSVFSSVAGAYPVYPPDDGLIGYTHCIIFVTPNVTVPC
ncbi:hypothetical protein [Deinococcus sedimenti]|uniref:Uncharacterized protein n=1 Tax=Deinococcus sedimenti TaxID=1867090 RepID=A0ABQ2SBN5_9DEIO|nr:hypothetical protein [Deinococcus sedimenti]GGS08718.1 hypothetical protein GCM10008960_38860 [Deinococcus sedimenti]